jgi:hypothetical protein
VSKTTSGANQNQTLVREKFIPVSIEIAYSGRRPDVEGKFIRERLKRPSWNGWIAATPTGVILNEEPYLDIVIHKGLQRWNELPEAERRPGLALENLGPVNPALDLAPPEGGLVLKVFIRSLARDEKGRLTAPAKVDLNNPGAPPIDAQAQRDHLWITAEEAACLVAGPRSKGQRSPVPAFLAERICRFYLKDSATCIPGTSASKYGGYSGSMTSVVEGSSDTAIRLRLEGSAQGNGPEFHLQGAVDYDLRKKTFTRFNLTAFSEKGHPEKASGQSTPLGIAFELGSAERGLDRIPPYFFTVDRWGGDPKAMADAYFRPGK